MNLPIYIEGVYSIELDIHSIELDFPRYQNAIKITKCWSWAGDSHTGTGTNSICLNFCLTTHQPLWVNLCHLLEKGRWQEIEVEDKGKSVKSAETGETIICPLPLPAASTAGPTHHPTKSDKELCTNTMMDLSMFSSRGGRDILEELDIFEKLAV